MLYTTENKRRTFSGEIENEKDVVLIDELTCEDLPFKVVRRELNKELPFLGHKLLSDWTNEFTLED